MGEWLNTHELLHDAYFLAFPAPLTKTPKDKSTAAVEAMQGPESAGVADLLPLMDSGADPADLDDPALSFTTPTLKPQPRSAPARTRLTVERG